MVAQPLSLCYYNPQTWTKRVPDLNTITRIPRRRQLLQTSEVRTKRVPDLNTITRIPRRRQLLETTEAWTKRVPDLTTITRIPRRRQLLETTEAWTKRVPDLNTITRIPRRRQLLQTTEARTKRVPDLTTITRIPRRRQLLQTTENVPVGMYNIDTEKNWDPLKPPPFGRKTIPYGEKLGTFYGKRYFRGTRPKFYDKHLAVLRYQLCHLKPKRYYFQLQEEEFQAEWRKMEKLFTWHYGSSRSGQKLQAPRTYFQDWQLVVFKFMNRFVRGRFIKFARPLPLILGLDDGIMYPAPKELYAMDEQFLSAPFCAITTIIRKEEIVLTNSFIESNFGIFSGTETLKDVQLLFDYCMDKLKLDFLFYLSDLVLLSVGDTYNVTVTLNPNCEYTIKYIEALLMQQINHRLYKNIENCIHSDNIRITNIWKYRNDNIFLCTDQKLLDSLHSYLNMPSKKLEIYAQRNTIIKDNLEIIHRDSEVPRRDALVNMVYLAMLDCQIYRIVILEILDFSDNEHYNVLLIDYGRYETIHFWAIWCRLPNAVVPGYICRMPPLSNRFVVYDWDGDGHTKNGRIINAFSDFIKEHNVSIKVKVVQLVELPYAENLEYMRGACLYHETTQITFRVYSDFGEMVADTRDVNFFNKLRAHMLSFGWPDPLL